MCVWAFSLTMIFHKGEGKVYFFTTGQGGKIYYNTCIYIIFISTSVVDKIVISTIYIVAIHLFHHFSAQTCI